MYLLRKHLTDIELISSTLLQFNQITISKQLSELSSIFFHFFLSSFLLLPGIRLNEKGNHFIFLALWSL